MKQIHWTGAATVIGMLILIFDGKTAFSGAYAGLELCIQTVIPSLFPFFILSMLLTDSLPGSNIAILRPLGRLCKIPKGAEPILISAFLGGYPVGAQSIAETYRNGQLTKENADRMLTFCNNTGPAFIFGMVSAVFSQHWVPWVLWGIQIISALLVAQVFSGHAYQEVTIQQASAKNISDILSSAIRIMASVCGWVILFRVFIAFSEKWFLWLFDNRLQALLIGLLELSNGCCLLSRITEPEIRFLLCACILSFGGICVTMQTFSVCNGLSMQYYLRGKLLQTLFSILLSLAVIEKNILPLIGVIFILFFSHFKNRYSIPKAVRV